MSRAQTERLKAELRDRALQFISTEPRRHTTAEVAAAIHADTRVTTTVLASLQAERLITRSLALDTAWWSPGAHPVPQTVVSHVVEACFQGCLWTPIENAGADPDDGEAAYRHWLNARGSLDVRLLKRTAVITTEVVSSGRQEL
jgi:hypothetical protein